MPIREFVQEHLLLFLLLANPLLGLGLGFFGQCIVGLFGGTQAAKKPALCAISAMFWTAFWIMYTWSVSPALELATAFTYYGAAIPLSALFACILARNENRLT